MAVALVAPIDGQVDSQVGVQRWTSAINHTVLLSKRSTKCTSVDNGGAGHTTIDQRLPIPQTASQRQVSPSGAASVPEQHELDTDPIVKEWPRGTAKVA